MSSSRQRLKQAAANVEKKRPTTNTPTGAVQNTERDTVPSSPPEIKLTTTIPGTLNWQGGKAYYTDTSIYPRQVEVHNPLDVSKSAINLAATKAMEESFNKKYPSSDLKFTNYKQTSAFGKNNGLKSSHNGIDYATPMNTPVGAIANGTVIQTGNVGTYGNLVKVRYDDGNIGYYSHLNSFNVKAGDKFRAGDILGMSGNTGRSTGPHLHLEVRGADDSYYNQIDPQKYIDMYNPQPYKAPEPLYYDFKTGGVKPSRETPVEIPISDKKTITLNNGVKQDIDNIYKSMSSEAVKQRNLDAKTNALVDYLTSGEYNNKVGSNIMNGKLITPESLRYKLPVDVTKNVGNEKRPNSTKRAEVLKSEVEKMGLQGDELKNALDYAKAINPTLGGDIGYAAKSFLAGGSSGLGGTIEGMFTAPLTKEIEKGANGLSKAERFKEIAADYMVRNLFPKMKPILNAYKTVSTSIRSLSKMYYTEERAKENGFKSVEEFVRSDIEKMYGKTDFFDKPANELAFKSIGVSDGAKFIGEISQVVGNMIPSIIASVATKNPEIGLAIMARSTMGQSANEALKNGATAEQAYYNGLLKGATEYLIEKMFGGIPSLGKGLFGSKADDLIAKLGESSIGKFLKSTYGKAVLELLERFGEGLEEAVSGLASGYIDRLTYDDKAELATAKEIGKDAFLGILVSFVMNAPMDVVKGISNISAKGVKTTTLSEPKTTPVASEQTNLTEDVPVLTEAVSEVPDESPRNTENIEPAQPTFEPMTDVEIDTALTPQEAQVYNIITSNLKRRAEESGILTRDVMERLQNVNAYNPSVSDIKAINNEMHSMFDGTEDAEINGYLNSLDRTLEKAEARNNTQTTENAEADLTPSLPLNTENSTSMTKTTEDPLKVEPPSNASETPQSLRDSSPTGAPLVSDNVSKLMRGEKVNIKDMSAEEIATLEKEYGFKIKKQKQLDNIADRKALELKTSKTANSKSIDKDNGHPLADKIINGEKIKIGEMSDGDKIYLEDKFDFVLEDGRKGQKQLDNLAYQQRLRNNNKRNSVAKNKEEPLFAVKKIPGTNSQSTLQTVSPKGETFGKADKKKVENIAKVLGREVEWYNDETALDDMERNSNGVFIPGDVGKKPKIRINENAENPYTVVLGHECFHSLDANTKKAIIDFIYKNIDTTSEKYQNWKKSIENAYKANNKTLSEKTLKEEFAAENMQQFFDNEEFLNRLKSENKGAYDKIKQWVKNLFVRFKNKGFYDLNSVSEATDLSERQLRKLADMFEVGLKKNPSNTSNKTKHYIEKTPNKKITLDDVKNIQKLPRKSISNFTNVEIKASEKIAKRLYGELREKSPFFRAWFGDWRANDRTTINIATKKASQKGLMKNKDTGWNIQISGKVFNETSRHRNTLAKIGYHHLGNISDIVENAVLLDSSPFEFDSKSPNSFMMHSLYSLSDTGQGLDLIKLFVDEIYTPNDDGTIKRAYKLNGYSTIRLKTGSGLGKNAYSTSNSTGNNYTVSDLFELVKLYDKNFNYHQSSKVVNADGTPKIVYHGTNKDFTKFESSDGTYWFSESYDYAEAMAEERGSNKVMSVYLDMKNPYYAKLPEGKFSDPAAEKSIIEAAKAGNYDGVIIECDTNNEIVYDKFYVVFKPTQIKSATDNIGTFDKSNPDINYSIKKSSPLSDLNEKYGTIPKGEKPARDVSIPKKVSETEYVSRHARTLAEAGITSDIFESELEQEIKNGTFSYEIVSDEKAQKHASDKIKSEGFERALNRWEIINEEDRKLTKNDIALGQALYNSAITRGNYKMAMKLAVDLVSNERIAAQNLQAARMIKKMTPDGKLYYAEKMVEKINRTRSANTPKIEIDEDLAKELLSAENSEQLEAANNKILKDIASQMQSSKLNKFRSWRYMAMLLNPTTHIRNVMGNVFFVPVKGTKDVFATVSERIFIRDKAKRSKSIFTTKAAREFAKNDYERMKGVLSGNKYNDATQLERMVRVYKNKILNGIYNATMGSLSAEDAFFKGIHYKRSLAQVMTARGWTAENMTAKNLEQARTMAIEEALKATFNDDSAFAKAISKIQKDAESGRLGIGKVGGTILSEAIDAVVPFKSTPTNIAKRGILEYSPIGILRGITQAVFDIKDGTKTASEAIDMLASGLTGSAIMVLGAFLFDKGILTMESGEDDKEDKYLKGLGKQGFAIKLGDKSYSLDWMAPASLPLFAGANIANYFEKEHELSLGEFIDAFTQITQPLYELSMLSSFNDLLEDVSYADNKMNAIVASIVSSYITQYFPTVLNKVSRTLDTKERKSYYDKNNPWLVKDLSYLINNVWKKIPVLSQYMQPSIDIWGNEIETGTLWNRVFANFLSPGYLKQDKATATDKKLLKLYEKTGLNEVLPSYASKSFTIDGETSDLTAEEYTQFAITQGQTSYNILTELFESELFDNLTDTEKVSLITSVYDYAKSVSKRQIQEERQKHKTIKEDYSQHMPKWMLKMEDAEKSGISNGDFMLVRKIISKMDENKASTDEQRLAIMNMNKFTANQKAVLDKALISPYRFIYDDTVVDYSNKTTFILTQMSDAAQRKKSRFPNMSAERYNKLYEAYSSGQKKAEKIEKLVEAGMTYTAAEQFYKTISKK